MGYPAAIIAAFVFLNNFHISTAGSGIKYALMENSPVEDNNGAALGQQLSAWELHVLNDLLFQIVTKQCPKISRPTASSMRDYIKASVKQAPNNQHQNANFLITYAKLLGCFDYLDSISRNPGKKLESNVHFIDDQDKEANEKLKSNSEEDQDDSVNVKEENFHFQWISQLSSVFTDLFRWKRDTEFIEEKEKKVKKDSQGKYKLSKLLHDMYRIVQISCPADLKAPAPFFKIIVHEILFWLSKDAHTLRSTALKYSKPNSLLDEISECLSEFQ